MKDMKESGVECKEIEKRLQIEGCRMDRNPRTGRNRNKDMKKEQRNKNVDRLNTKA